MQSEQIRSKFLSFFEQRGHVIVPSSSLLTNDPSVLLTTAGMQQFKAYYTGALDPLRDNHPNLGKPLGSKSVASIQKSFRTSDIDEVGDESHLTFFEMLGNFSFRGYGKEESIKFAYDFITKEMGLQIDYVTVFSGDTETPKDTESEKIWQSIAPGLNIQKAGRDDNFWGPTGDEGPCGPTTEIYVRGVEIWNIVFNELYCRPDKTFQKLDAMGVDTGMGLERLAMVSQNTPTIFETDLFSAVMELLPAQWPVRTKRIVADHTRATAFLLADGVRPSNKEAGYILRRLARRVMVHENIDVGQIFSKFTQIYKNSYPELDTSLILAEYQAEENRFKKTLSQGLRKMEEMDEVDAKSAFYLYETYGLPFEVINDHPKAASLRREDFDKEFANHQERSRGASAGAFKGGLVDNEPQTLKHHTAHHLLLAALRQILGEHVYQRGSNVSSARLRIDFAHVEKMTPEQIKAVEHLVNDKITEDLKIERDEMAKEEAQKLGALAEFGAKYGDVVSVYTIYNKDGSVFSREFCGGPHVDRTGVLGKFRILKEESSGAGVRRIKARVE